MYATPVKQTSKNLKFCIVCKNMAKEPRKVESTKTKYNIKECLLKYGGISVESGTICERCVNKLYSLHEKTTEFYRFCQTNFKPNSHQVKRMVSTPSEPVLKRKNTTKTPKKILSSKIPTPIKSPISYTPNSSTRSNIDRTTRSPSKLPTPVFRRNITHEKENISTRRKCLFGETDLNTTLLLTNTVEDIAVGMELEIGSSFGQEFLQTAETYSSSICDTEILVEKENKQERHAKKESDKKHSEHMYARPTISVKKKSRRTLEQNSKLFAQPESHDYVKSENKPSKFSSFYEELRVFMKEYREGNQLAPSDRYQLLFACQSGDSEQICNSILSIGSVRKELVNKVTNENDVITSGMTNRKYDTSVLMKKTQKELKCFSWTDVVEEFKENFPDLLYQLLSLMLKKESQCLYTKLEKVLPRLGVIYGILMQGRNQELSLIQRLNSSLLFNSICDVKVYDRLQKQGLCLGYKGSLYFLGVIGGKFNEALIDLIKKEKRFRIVGDNINWLEGVHDQRKDHSSHMVHAFGSAILVQNVEFSTLSNTYPQLNFEETPCRAFIPSADDYNIYKYDYTVLMSREVCKFLPYFQFYADVIPSKLSKPVSEKLAQKTKVVPMPVLLKNEQKAQDVVEILEYYEKLVSDSCTAAGRNLDDFFVHIGGDQLTRERFSQAKCMRAHEDTAKDRFENLSPITFELFHMHMNFLQMAYAILFSENSTQDPGTLKALQNRISRTNIGENINAHYDADKDFFISVVDMYVVEAFMEFFGMDDVNSVPTRNTAPEFKNEGEKRNWYFQTVGRLIDEFVFSKKTDAAAEPVETEGHYIEILLSDGRKLSVKICNQKVESVKQDYVSNYARRVLELGLLFKDLLDATKLPERGRHITLLKLTMLLLKSHRNLSKYSYEILRLLVHQICILSEKAANEEFYAMFVNSTGHFDGHIPADLRMEYLVKTVKSHLKHMYSNKTEKNIEKRTGAIATISDISERYDSATNVIVRTKKHSDMSSREDELILLETIRAVRPFRETPGRCHAAFPNIRSSAVDTLDLRHYHAWLTKKIRQFATEFGN